MRQTRSAGVHRTRFARIKQTQRDKQDETVRPPDFGSFSLHPVVMSKRVSADVPVCFFLFHSKSSSTSTGVHLHLYTLAKAEIFVSIVPKKNRRPIPRTGKAKYRSDCQMHIHFLAERPRTSCRTRVYLPVTRYERFA